MQYKKREQSSTRITRCTNLKSSILPPINPVQNLLHPTMPCFHILIRTSWICLRCKKTPYRLWFISWNHNSRLTGLHLLQYLLTTASPYSIVQSLPSIWPLKIVFGRGWALKCRSTALPIHFTNGPGFYFWYSVCNPSRIPWNLDQQQTTWIAGHHLETTDNHEVVVT